MNEPITNFTTRFLAAFEEPPSNVVEFRGVPHPKPGTKIVDDLVVLEAFRQSVRENVLEEAIEAIRRLKELWSHENQNPLGNALMALDGAIDAIRALKDVE